MSSVDFSTAVGAVRYDSAASSLIMENVNVQINNSDRFSNVESILTAKITDGKTLNEITFKWINVILEIGDFPSLFAYQPFYGMEFINCISPTNLGTFIGNKNLVSIKFKNTMVSGTTRSMNAYFQGCSNLLICDLSGLYFPGNTGCEGMFSQCEKLKYLNLNGFPTGNVTNMYAMFSDCNSLRTINVSSLNTNSVTSMGLMFLGCSNLISIDLSNWDTSRVQTVKSMFASCTNLQYINFGPNFSFASVTKDSASSYFDGFLDSTDNLKYITINSTYYRYNSSKHQLTNHSSFLYDLVLYDFPVQPKSANTINGVTELIFGSSTYHIPNAITIATYDSFMSTMIWKNITLLVTKETDDFNFNDILRDQLKTHITNSKELLDINYKFNNVSFIHTYEDRKTLFSNQDYMKKIYFTDCSFINQMPQFYYNTVITSLSFDGICYLPEDCSDTFHYLSYLTNIDVTGLDTSNVTDISKMFYNCYKLTSTGGATYFNTTSVTNMSGIFYYCSGLTSLDLTNWNTSNVTDMSEIFYQCNKLASLNVSNWNTSNVTVMNNMFNQCRFSNIDLSNWDVSNVTNMDTMFANCVNLTSLDLSNWNTSSLTSIRNMFSACINLRNLNIKNIDVSHVTDMVTAFANMTSINYLDLSNWVTSSATKIMMMFYNCLHLKELDISKFDFSNVTNMSDLFKYNYALQLLKLPSSAYDSTDNSIKNNHTSYTLEKTPIMRSISNNVTTLQFELTLLEAITGGYFTYDATNSKMICEGVYINVDTSTFADEEIQTALTNLITDGKTLDQLTYVFNNVSLKCPYNSDLFKTQTYMKYMEFSSVGFIDYDPKFTNNTSLLTIKFTNTSLIRGAGELFDGCKNMTTCDVSGLNTGSSNSFAFMFRNCENLTSLDLSNFNTSGVTKTNYMFYGCSKLQSITFGPNFTCSDVTDMSFMFRYCSTLTSLDLSNWNTSNVTNMSDMFNNCTGLISLDLSNWNTSNVTRMYGMFSNCSQLTSLNLTNWVNTKVTNMYGMFNNCSNLSTLTLTGFKTSAATSMGSMFSNCSSLLSLDLNEFDTTNVTDMRYMFYQCTSLISLNLASFRFTNVNAIDGFLSGSGLKNIKLYSLAYDTNSNTILCKDSLTYSLPTKIHTSSYNSEITVWFNYFTLLEAINYGVVTYTSNLSQLSIDRVCIYDTTNSFESNVVKEALLSKVTDGKQLSALKYSIGISYIKCNAENANLFSSNSYIKNIHFSTVTFEDWTPKFLSNSVLEKITMVNCVYAGSLYRMFYGCTSLREVSITGMNTNDTSLTNMTQMFYGCVSLTTVTLNHSSLNKLCYVTNMKMVFTGCTKLETVDMSKFVTNNVTTMESMFSNCTNLKNLNISGFNSSNLTNAQAMFANCSALTSITFGANFTCSNVTNMSNMFYDCKKLTSLNLSNWNTSNVTIMIGTFANCWSLTSLNLSNWNTSNVTNMASMFASCRNLSILNLASFNFSKVTNFNNFLNLTTALKQIRIKQQYYDIDNNQIKGSGTTTYTLPKTNIFSPLVYGNYYINFDSFGLLEAVNSEFTYYTSNDTSIMGMNYICINDSTDFSNTDVQTALTAKITDGKLFDEITFKFQMVKFDVESNSTLFSSQNYMKKVQFHGVSFENNVPLFKQNTKLVDFEAYSTRFPTLEEMFMYCTNMTRCFIDGSCFTNCESLSYTFYGCSSLTTINQPKNWNASNITNMTYTFAQCANLSSLDFGSSFNEGNVIYAGGLFSGCSGLTELNITNFNTSNAYTVNNMFENCSKLTTLDLSNFDTSSTDSTSLMFSGCQKLESLTLGPNFTCSNVTNMSSMFYGCISLTTLDLSNFNTSNARYMNSMFRNCNVLKKLNVISFRTPNVIEFDYMFAYCSSLIGLNLMYFNFGNASSFKSFLTSTTNLCYLILQSSYYNISTNQICNSSGTTYDISKSRAYYGTSGTQGYVWFSSVTLDQALDDTDAIFIYTTGWHILDIRCCYLQPTPSDTIMTESIKTKILNRITDGVDISDVTFLIQDCKIQSTTRNTLFYNQDYITKIELRNVTFASYTPSFYKNTNLTRLKFSNVTAVGSLNNFLDSCTKLITLDLSGLNTSAVTEMLQMFQSLNLTSIDISNFDTSNVKSMSNMFHGCSKLTSIALPNELNMSKVTTVQMMFGYCSNLLTVDLTKFYPSDQLTTVSQMFMGCTKINNLNFDNFNVATLKYMAYMFYQCKGLTNVNLSKLNTSNTFRMAAMFGYCESLRNLDLSTFDFSSIGTDATGASDLINNFLRGTTRLDKLKVSSSIYNYSTNTLTTGITTYTLPKTPVMESSSSGVSTLYFENLPTVVNDSVTYDAVNLKMNFSNDYMVGSSTTFATSNISTALLNKITNDKQLSDLIYEFNNMEIVTTTALNLFKTQNYMKNIEFTNCHFLNDGPVFADNNTLETIKFDNVDMDKHEFSGMFTRCAKLKSADLSGINLS